MKTRQELHDALADVFDHYENTIEELTLQVDGLNHDLDEAKAETEALNNENKGLRKKLQQRYDSYAAIGLMELDYYSVGQLNDLKAAIKLALHGSAGNVTKLHKMVKEEKL